jgi:hypothetical protein
MACGAITDIVVRESGRYTNDEIYTRAFPRSFWIGLIKRDQFPEGMGEIISNLTYERSAPTDAVPTWSDVTVSDGALGGACLPTATKIAIASTTRTWNLQRRALEGPDFCVEELRTPFAIRKQLDAIMDVLTDYSIIEWEIRYRHEYLRLVKRKVVATMAGGVEGTGTGFPAACPNAVLDYGLLFKYKQKLIRDGAAGSALGKLDGSAVMTIIMSGEQSEALARTTNIRDDLRWGKPSELLASYGVDRTYRGFFHLIDDFPIRGNCSGNTFTEVAAFDTVAATKGNKAEIRAAYESAADEVTFLFDPTVMTSRIPRTITNPAPGFHFNPVNYMGDWRAVNILDRTCNPDGTIIYHRGILASGSEPVHPERGVAILSLRCDPARELVSSCV